MQRNYFQLLKLLMGTEYFQSKTRVHYYKILIWSLACYQLSYLEEESLVNDVGAQSIFMPWLVQIHILIILKMSITSRM